MHPYKRRRKKCQVSRLGKQFCCCRIKLCDPCHVFKCYIYSDHSCKAMFHLEELKRGMSNSPFFLFPKSLTNIPLRTLGSAQPMLLSIHFCKIPSQALTFFSEKKPHFLCKNHVSTVHSLPLSKFQLTNLASPLHFTSQIHINS